MSLFPNRETIDAIKKTCAAAGVEFVGVQDRIGGGHDVLFNPRDVWGTITLPLEEFSAEKIYSAVFFAKNAKPQEKPQ